MLDRIQARTKLARLRKAAGYLSVVISGPGPRDEHRLQLGAALDIVGEEIDRLQRQLRVGQHDNPDKR